MIRDMLMAAAGSSGGGDVYDRLFVTDTYHSRTLDYSNPACFSPPSNFQVGVRQANCPMLVPKGFAAVRTQNTATRQPILQKDEDDKYYLLFEGGRADSMTTSFGGGNQQFNTKKIIATWGAYITHNASGLYQFQFLENFLAQLGFLNNGSSNYLQIGFPNDNASITNTQVSNLSSFLPLNTKVALTLTIDLAYTNSRQRLKVMLNGVEYQVINSTFPTFTTGIGLGSSGIVANSTSGSNCRSYFEAVSIVDWRDGDLAELNAWTMDKIKA